MGQRPHPFQTNSLKPGTPFSIIFYRYHFFFFLLRGKWNCEYRDRNNFWTWWADGITDNHQIVRTGLVPCLVRHCLKCLYWGGKREKTPLQTHPINPWVLLQHTECSEFPCCLTNFLQLLFRCCKVFFSWLHKKPSDLDSHYTRRVCKWFVQPTKSLWMHREGWTLQWAQAPLTAQRLILTAMEPQCRKPKWFCSNEIRP